MMLSFGIGGIWILAPRPADQGLKIFILDILKDFLRVILKDSLKFS